MRKIKVLVELELHTDKNSDSIEKAIKKGIYWGLDVTRVAEPKLVHNIDVRTYNG